ncbi:MAG: FliM/FliN family flagellar motor switch protein [Hyphomonadaceae bacterium]
MQHAENMEKPAERREDSEANNFKRSVYGLPVLVTVSVGQKTMSVAELLKLGEETIIPLSSHIEDPVDLTINDKVVARGELIEGEDGGLAVKITEIEGETND